MTRMTLVGIADIRSESRGDGLLTVVPPPGIPAATVVQRLVRELPRVLDRHNSTHRDSARIRLRVAVNVGPVTTGTMGVSGESIIIAARLLEAPALKEALAQSPAHLGLIVSRLVYETAIRHILKPVELAAYSHIQVKVKDFMAPAWMKLFGVLVSSAYFARRAASDSLGAAL